MGAGKLVSAFQRFEAFEFIDKTLVQAQEIGTPWFLSDQQLRQAASRGFEFDAFDSEPPTSVYRTGPST